MRWPDFFQPCSDPLVISFIFIKTSGCSPVPGASGLSETGCGAGDWSVDGHGDGGDVGWPQAFHNGRHLAAWLGLVPRQYSSGGKESLAGISNRGSRYGRSPFISGMNMSTVCGVKCSIIAIR